MASAVLRRCGVCCAAARRAVTRQRSQRRPHSLRRPLRRLLLPPRHPALSTGQCPLQGPPLLTVLMWLEQPQVWLAPREPSASAVPRTCTAQRNTVSTAPLASAFELVWQVLCMLSQRAVAIPVHCEAVSSTVLRRGAAACRDSPQSPLSHTDAPTWKHHQVKQVPSCIPCSGEKSWSSSPAHSLSSCPFSALVQPMRHQARTLPAHRQVKQFQVSQGPSQLRTTQAQQAQALASLGRARARARGEARQSRPSGI